jgi:hypothetical protein
MWSFRSCVWFTMIVYFFLKFHQSAGECSFVFLGKQHGRFLRMSRACALPAVPNISVTPQERQKGAWHQRPWPCLLQVMAGRWESCLFLGSLLLISMFTPGSLLPKLEMILEEWRSPSAVSLWICLSVFSSDCPSWWSSIPYHLTLSTRLPGPFK